MKYSVGVKNDLDPYNKEQNSLLSHCCITAKIQAKLFELNTAIV